MEEAQASPTTWLVQSLSTACSIPALASSASAVFAVPECTLDQGPGKMSIARIVAREWQTDGYLKPGKIVGVRRLTTEEFMSVLLA